MPVIQARIDQRLIHGIVVNQWNSKLNPKRFMVVDDVVSHQPEIKDSMKLAKPAGTGMSIIDFEKASTNFKKGNYDAQRVFLIVKEPEMLLKLMDAGVEIPEVNLGIIFAEDGRENVTKFINLNKKEVEDLKEIEKRGVPVKIQYVPEDAPIAFDKAIEGHEFN
ncbi:MAG: PTS sugar transporter subunit IIB [Lactobacillus sp.]|nr:PTS sugar transporter subunit IIB [Lactobacillus sp.]